jgi:hypothetical protein
VSCGIAVSYYFSRRSISGFGERLAGVWPALAVAWWRRAVDGPRDHVGDASVGLDDQDVEDAA